MAATLKAKNKQWNLTKCSSYASEYDSEHHPTSYNIKYSSQIRKNNAPSKIKSVICNPPLGTCQNTIHTD